MNDIATALPARFSTRRIYVARAIAAIIWAITLAIALSSTADLSSRKAVPAFVAALLVLYPVIDVIATAAEARIRRPALPLAVSAAVSAAAAIGIIVAASHGADAVLRVFGVWALLAGLIQLGLAITRRRRGLTGQWAMVLSGGISAVAGLSFVQMATKTTPNLTGLAGYATLGAIFFLVSARRLNSRR